jgi:hypothetical protein
MKKIKSRFGDMLARPLGKGLQHFVKLRVVHDGGGIS